MNQPRPPRPPGFSLRDVPAGIYLALGLSFASSVVVAVATAMQGERGPESYEALQRWWMLDGATFFAQSIVFSCGLFEVARRHTGTPRMLTQLAGGLLLTNLVWSLVGLVVTFVKPDNFSTMYDWLGRGIGLFTLAGMIILTIAADAWRRVPLAAAGILLLQVTSSWIPLLGSALHKLLGESQTVWRVYGVGREAIASVALLFIVASLAAAGRPAIENRRAAVGGTRLAYGALWARVIGAIAFACLAGAAYSEGSTKFAVIGGIVLIVVTMLVLSLGVHQLAGSRVPGLPTFRLYVAAVILLAWVGLQVQQASALIQAMGHDYGRDEAVNTIGIFSVIGPLCAMFAIALVGSAFATYAATASGPALAREASARTIAFVALSLVSVGLQSLLVKAESRETLTLLALCAAAASVVALAILISVFKHAAQQLEAPRGVPAARVIF